MALFQTSVLKSKLSMLNEAAVEKAYKKYKTYFLNTTIQENIKTAKEEQFQATFLNELFVNVLGYTLFPNPDSNLTTEFKNEKNNRKADGAILKDGTAIGVIELKGMNTKDLESIRQQAFDYKANHKGCVYVITSNFEKLRFYINDATEFEEFDLFTLSRDRFNLLYLCLNIENVLNNVPLRIKEASIAEEEQITKAFYNDYSVFKRELYRDLVRNNSKTVKEKLSTNIDIDEQEEIARLEKNVKLTLFQKSQKLIDRFLFVFFAEDRMLLPANSTLQILNKWKNDWDFGDERPLYDLFKQYFNFLDTGRKGTQNRAEIYAYNGGLFKPDAILDALEIDSNLLYEYTLKLSNYDFESQVDVNILGHIFENSLNEIESVNAEIEGGEFDKSTSKRKKDGVFYTPKYITKYIVENTVGKRCEEKKAEHEIIDEDYITDKKRQKKTIKGLVDKLTTYRDWLLQITICDPACGSGAFLNQALDFLILEHRYIDELQAKLFGDAMVLSDVEKSILENNLFGVDLNEESVEIAKLSLWLRTAQPNRKLNDLSNNIKCGNSLIDDPDVAGDKAFNWQQEFPTIFAKGGFDVIIGNPPYITFALGAGTKHNEEIIDYLKNNYESGNYKVSSYIIFFEKGLNLINKKGILSYIIPNTYHNNYYYKDFRTKLINDYKIERLINITYKVFEDAEMGFTSIPFISKKTSNNTLISDVNSVDDFLTLDIESIAQNSFLNYPDYKFLFGKNISLWTKSNQNCFDLSSNEFQFYNGIKTGNNKKFISDEKLGEQYEEIITGKNFQRYFTELKTPFILYDPKQLWSNTNKEMFDVESKLIIRRTGDSLNVAYDNKGRFCQDTIHLLFSKNQECNNKYLLTLLNSTLINFLYRIIVPEIGKAFAEVKIINLKKLPIKKASLKNQQLFIEKADQMLSLNKELNEVSHKFQRALQRKFETLEKLSKKQENWYELTYAEFIKELKKKKITLSLSEEAEWEEYFLKEQQKAVALKNQITTTDKEIDAMVYELYGLSEEEIEIVENS